MAAGPSLAVENIRIAQEWRSKVCSDLKWTRSKRDGGGIHGEASGYYAEAAGFGRRVYLKPGRPDANAVEHARAAREKIAADLAHDLELPVPPCQLALLDDPPGGCVPTVVISLVMYPRQFPWSVYLATSRGLDESSEGLATAKVLGDCSPMWPFDTWLGQFDHGDHPHNIVWGYDPGYRADQSILFLDFANALGHRGAWEGDGWKSVVRAPFPAIMQKNANQIAMVRTAQRIRDFEEKKLEEIVQRIPDVFLAAERKALVLQCLLSRRALVADLFAGATS